MRILYITLAHTYRIRLAQDHFQFGWEMGRIARALATGYGYADPFTGHTGPTAWCPPLYPLLIAAAFKLAGVYTPASAWLLLTFNSLVSAATAPLVYEIAARCTNRRVALWSAWLWALYPAAMQYAVRWVWEMSLSTFFFTAILVVALRLRRIGDLASNARANTAALWTIFGLLWGLIALSNSSLLLFLPFCTLWLVWPLLRFTRDCHPAATPQLVKNLALASMVFALVIAPWIIRNGVAFHAFVPLRSNFGAELYQSALPENQGFPLMATLPPYETSPDLQRYKRLGELAYSHEQGERGKALIRANKATFARHILKRVYFFWAGVPHPVEKSFLSEFLREAFFCVTSLSGLLGLALALRRGVPGAWLFAAAFACLPLIYYVITVQARFRHPLEPLITILSVYLFQSADRTRTWSWQAARTDPS